MLWDEVCNELSGFPNAVLTGVDTCGFPFSLRCTPLPDLYRKVLVVPVDRWTEMVPGPASLLCHRHDEHLDQLKSFVVLGRLEQSDSRWIFVPTRWVKGTGYDGLVGFVRFLLDGRRAANRYLNYRGLPRPQVRWDQMDQMDKEIKAGLIN